MKKILFIVLIYSLVFISCGPKYYNFGWEKFFNKDYSGANQIFRKIHVSKPNDPINLKGIGISEMMLKNYDEAMTFLQRSYEINKEDPETILNIGLVYDAQKKYDKAIEHLSKFVDMNFDSKIRAEAQKRLNSIKREIFLEEAKSLIANEGSISKSNVTTGTVAITPFMNRGEKGDYDALQKGIPQMMITDFGYIQNLSILERMRIDELLKELKLSETNLIDKSTTQRIGKLLKAENIVTGSYAINNNNSVSMDVYVINVAKGQISDIIEKKGDVDNFFDLQKDISLAALEKIGVKISEDQRKLIKTLPTESFFEFLTALKKRNLEEEEIVLQGVDFLNSLLVISEVPATQISVTITSPEIKTTINPVETPLPTPPKVPR
jgi:tetratricopeptide (TPR) repeat protein